MFQSLPNQVGQILHTSGKKIFNNLVTGDESLLFLKGTTEAPKLFTAASTYRRL